MIDPRTLAVQRAVIAGEAIPAHRHLGHLRLVRKPMPVSCECGSCRTCRKRIAMRQYRAVQRGEAERLPPGPRMDRLRQCSLCGRHIANENGSGFCKDCQKSRPSRCRWMRAHIFTDGGGI